MFGRKNRAIITIIGLVILAVILFFTGNPVKNKITVRQFNGTLLDKPRDISLFSLTGIDGKPFTHDSLKGQWTIIFFGFTRCGSMCPTTMAELGKMHRLLDSQGVTPLPRVVMITLDPARDSLDKLNQYVKAFDPLFFGARGSDSSIRAMTKELGIAYMNVTRHGSPDKTYDDIEHTGAVMLFNPKGQLAAFFTTPHQASLLADDYRLLIA